MSYINTKLLKSRNLSLNEFAVLSLLRQNKFENNVDILETELNTDVLKKFEDLNLIEQVKRKNKAQNELELIRTTKKANEWLDDIGTPNVEEQHLKMRDYLISIYLNHEDTERVVGNKKLIAIYISILQAHLGINIYQFYYLCEFFLSEHVFTKKLENIFMDRNKIRYGDFKNHIEDSSLFQFYEQRKQEVENYWEQKIKK
jgi:hypothetical protein